MIRLIGLLVKSWAKREKATGKIMNGLLTIRISKKEVSNISIYQIVTAIKDKYRGRLSHKPSNQKRNEFIKVVAMRANINDLVETRITKGESGK